MSNPSATAPGRDETTDLAKELCRRIEHRGWLTEPERAALARLVSHVAALRDDTDRALHARGVWSNVDKALGELLGTTAARIRP